MKIFPLKILLSKILEPVSDHRALPVYPDSDTPESQKFKAGYLKQETTILRSNALTAYSARFSPGQAFRALARGLFPFSCDDYHIRTYMKPGISTLFFS